MKGILYKTDNGWEVSHATYDITKQKWTAGKLPLHPDDVKQIKEDSLIFDNIEARIDAYPDVEFETVNMGFGPDDNVLIYAKLIKPEYPELEGTINLCNDKIWDDIYDEYSTEQYPPFGGPFTDALSFIDWLKQYYIVPERILWVNTQKKNG
jgi:hypothetical protein